MSQTQETQTIDWSKYTAPPAPMVRPQGQYTASDVQQQQTGQYSAADVAPVTITPDAAPTAPSQTIDWSKYATPVTITPDAAPSQPGFAARTSQATLGTQSPWEQAKKEWSDFTNDPVGSLTNAAKQVAMMPVNLAYQAVHHPLDLSEQIMPVNRAIADAKGGNLSGAAGDITGGLLNTVPLALGAGKGMTATDQTGAFFKRSASLKAPADSVAAFSDFQKAIPATKSAPYTVEQLTRARPYLEEQHGINPISADSGVMDTRDAADSAIGKIEEKVSEAIAHNPQDTITTQPLNDVKAALSQNQRGQEFVQAGLGEIQALNLDQPKTVAQADAIRRQLNLENQAALSKNNYKLEAARASDPAFAAREAAAESLRNGIYGKLQQRGIQGVQDLRQDEGALIAIRNAAQDQIFSGEKTVSSSAQTGIGRQTAAALTKATATGAGATLGGAPGAIIGAGAGELAARFFTPEALTRNELAARSFSKQVAGSPDYLTIPPKPGIAGLLGSGPKITPSPADTSGPSHSGVVPGMDPSTRAARLGLLLNAKPGEPLVTPSPRGPLQLPAKSGAALVTPLPRESMLDYLKRHVQP